MNKKENSLKSDILNFVKYNKRINREEINHIKKNYEKNNFENKKLRKNLKTKIYKIRKNVDEFKIKKDLFSKGLIKSEILQKLAKTIQIMIKNFKEEESKNFEKITNEKVDKKEEIELHKLKLRKITETKPKLKRRRKSGKKKENKNNLNKIDNELELIKKKIKKNEKDFEVIGGINCSWLKEEQNDFIKILAKFKNNPNSVNFRENIIKAFPLFSEQQIEIHIENFKIQQNLIKEKKKLILEFKKIKKKKNANVCLELQKKIVTEVKKKILPNKKERLLMKNNIEKWKKQIEINKFIKEEKMREIKEKEKEKKKLFEKNNLEEKKNLKKKLEDFKKKKKLEKKKKK